MVSGGGEAAVFFPITVLVVRSEVDVVQLEVVFDVSPDGVDVQGTKVSTEFFLLCYADVLEVLVAEDNDAAFGDQQREFILLQVAELGELQTADFGADYGGEFGYFEVWVSLGEEVGFFFVGHEAAVVEFEGLEGREAGFVVVDREIG